MKTLQRCWPCKPQMPVSILAIYLSAWFGVASSVGEEEVRTAGPSLSWTRMERSHTIISRLVPQSEAIALVSVLDRKKHPDTDDEIYTLQIHEAMYGDPPSEVHRSITHLYHAPSLPQIGDRGIMFMSRRPPHNIPLPHIIIESLRATDQTPAVWRIMGGARGFILGDVDELHGVADAVRHYVRWRIESTVTPIEHARFLARIWQSDSPRLHMDREHELMAFRNTFSREDFEVWVAHPEFPEMLRAIWREWEEKRQASIRFRDRETIEAEFFKYDWEMRITSGDIEQVLSAIRFLYPFTPDELRAYQDLWGPALRDLLQSDNWEIQIRAVSVFNLIQDPAGIPVVISLLRDPDIPHKPRLLHGLQHVTGQAFPYDPDAPEQVREEQIRVWEEWWREQSE